MPYNKKNLDDQLKRGIITGARHSELVSNLPKQPNRIMKWLGPISLVIVVGFAIVGALPTVLPYVANATSPTKVAGIWDKNKSVECLRHLSRPNNFEYVLNACDYSISVAVCLNNASTWSCEGRIVGPGDPAFNTMAGLQYYNPDVLLMQCPAPKAIRYATLNTAYTTGVEYRCADA